MEWLIGPKESENMEVDIGHMGRMELKATRSSVYVYDGGNDYTNTYIPTVEEDVLKNIAWDKEITVQKAARELEVKMYTSHKVCQESYLSGYISPEKLQ